MHTHAHAGILLEYEQSGKIKSKSIDFLDLRPDSDVELLADEVVAREPLVMERREQVHRLITSVDLETGVSCHLI